MITSREAATVAKQHGLNLSDAAAIARLAATTEEAEELAELFKPDAKPEMNQWIRGRAAERRRKREGLAQR